MKKSNRPKGIYSMSIQSEREAKIFAKRLQAIIKLKNKLQNLKEDQLSALLRNDPLYVPGDMDDDFIELCSVLASIRYFQEEIE